MQQRASKIRIFAAMMIALLLCVQVSAPPLSACAEAAVAPEDALKIEVVIKPDDLASPREVTLSFTIDNQTETQLRNITLTSPDGLLSEPIGQLNPTEVQTFNRMHSVTQAELDAGVIAYIITCDTDSGRLSYPANAYIQKNTVRPQVEFTRRISNIYAAESGNVVVVYNIKNTGNVEVNALSLSDPLGNFIGRIETLDVGESKTFTSHATIDESAISSPSLTYVSGPDGENTYTAHLDDITISTAYSSINIMLTAERSIFDENTAEVRLTLLNMGDILYSDITIYDDIYGGIIADAIELQANSEPLNVDYTYPLRDENLSFRWRVTGNNAAGDHIDFVTNTAEIDPINEPGEIQLSLSTETTMPRINRGGYVPFTAALTNNGTMNATNVKLVEETLGEICTLAVVPTGEPLVTNFTLPIKQETTLIFSAQYLDERGVQRTTASAPIEITIGKGGVTPNISPSANSLFEGISLQVSSSSMYTWMIVIACIVLVVLVAILLLTSHKARKDRKDRIAAKKLRSTDDNQKTTRIRPIIQNGKK